MAPALKILKIDPQAQLPRYESAGAAGLDLRAFLTEELAIPPMGRAKVPTGLKPEIPEGYEGQVRPRSGLAIRYGITVLNSPGTIDSDYRGGLEVILINFGTETFTVKNGERIAQLVIAPVCRAEIAEVLMEAGPAPGGCVTGGLTPTVRGSGGFGSTGL